MTARVVISGCSGGGKSTLIEALARRGLETFPEPGRLVVREELASGGTALPWVDMAAFAARALALSLRFHAAARSPLAFYDRSALDQLAWYDDAGAPLPDALAGARVLRYHRLVLLVPPWPDLFAADEERRHGLDEAVAEHDRLRRAYPAAGYEVVEVPRRPVEERVAWVLAALHDGLPAAARAALP